MLTETIITDIHSQEEMDKVVEVLRRLGNIPVSMSGNYLLLKIYKNGEFGVYPISCDELYWPHLTAKEFFEKYDKKEEQIPNFNVLNKVICKKNKNNPTSEHCVGDGKSKNMENIVNFFNDLKVSNEDIELRKAGLKDENLNWTEDARQIVMDLEAQEEGYKNYSEMVIVVGNSLMSSLELSYAFDNHYELLLETAKKYNRKDEKKDKK